MNGEHHADLTGIAAHLAGIPKDKRSLLIAGASSADHIADVRCDVPFHELFPGTWSALCHFQRPDGTGYYWDADKSLGALESLGDIAIHMAGSKVTGTSATMLRALEHQRGKVLSDFRFPSAAEYGSYWSTFPAYSEEWGRACHMIQDSCCPHHAWGSLLWGHQDFEDEAEARWFEHRKMLELSSDKVGNEREFCQRVRVEYVELSAQTIHELIEDNAAWSLTWFGMAHRQEECSVIDCLALCLRAIASTARGLEIMRAQ